MIPVINRRPSIILLSSIMFILIAAAGLTLAITPRDNIIFPGVSVNGQYVGGLTGPQAAKLMIQRFEEKSKTGYLQLHYGREKWVIPHEDIGLSYDFSATAEEALKTGRKGSDEMNAVAMLRTYFTKPDIPLRYELDRDKLDRVLVDIGSQIDIAAQNASICIYYGNIKILPAVTGRTFNFYCTRQQIEDALGRIDSNPLILDVETQQPEFKSDSLKGINGSIGNAITAVTPSKPYSFAAVKSAVSTLNGTLVRSGKEFSFNQDVGRDLKELIYRYGTVIQRNGKPVFAKSGGTSQVASTLYQAVLQSGLKVTERYTHIIPPADISPGQDAAVVRGKLDFKFVNNTEHPVYIMAEIKDNKLIVNLMGAKKNI